MVEAHIDSERGPLRIVFSGDVGRYDAPLHSDPDRLPDCHFLVLESTYGDRNHTTKSMDEQIGEVESYRQRFEQQVGKAVESYLGLSPEFDVEPS